jgi:mono/diheme cytochrome c family protein
MQLFHMDSSGGIACASCHPEGQDDGRVWTFNPIGARRTQNFAGGFLNTAPFHWEGDMGDFRTLVHDVFARRMGGGLPDDVQLEAFAKWIDAVPAVPAGAAADVDAALRGQALFEDAAVACASCHVGGTTNNLSYDVGTGGKFQVPTLRGIASRGPYLHDGCALTLNDRFGPCGGGDRHGRTSQLTAEQIADLVAYLETL